MNIAKVLGGPLLEAGAAAVATAVLGEKAVHGLRPYRDMTPEEIKATRNELPPPAGSTGSSPSSSSPSPEVLAMIEAAHRNARLQEQTSNALMTRMDVMERMAIINLNANRIVDMEDEFESSVQEALGNWRAAEQVPMTRYGFARRLAERGLSAERIRTVFERIRARYGTTQAARAIATRWLVDKALPAAAGAASGFLAGRAPAVFREGKGDIVGADDDEITRAAEEVNDPAATGTSFGDSIRAPHSAFDKGAFKRAYDSLPGAASGTAAPDMPFGPIDSLLPKSAPSIPSSSNPSAAVLPGASIFTEPLSGDELSERPSMPRANVMKSNIPLPVALVSISPRESYADIEHRYVRPREEVMPTPQQTLKRKASTITSHQDRGVEAQIPQNYDPTFVPGMPSSVNANSSVEWREYTAPYKGYNVPLTESIVVGIGYDAETSERELAQASTSEGTEHALEAGPGNASTTTAQPSTTPASNEVNSANVTNPAFQNMEKSKPTAQGKEPLAVSHLRP